MAEDKRALEIIKLEEKERANQSNFRNLWQETANLVFPRENQITIISSPGQDKTKEVYDNTAILDSQDMVSGLSAAFIPSGQQFFALVPKNKALSEIDIVRRYLSRATEITHDELFESNFMLQLNETLRSLVVFGTGCLFSEWDSKSLCLNFKDWDISFYQILEDNHGNVDTLLLRFPLTARQAYQQFGDKAGPKAVEAANNPDKINDTFEFIHCVRPRKKRNRWLSDNLNMPWESLYVNVKEKIIADEGGFEEFCYAVPRWMKSSSEKWGRGQGTEGLSDVKVLNQMKKDFIECGDKWNNPPLEILSSFDGTVKTYPGATNFVVEKNSIQAIHKDALGNFPITREMLEFQQEVVHKIFFKDIFVQLGDLKGDRRTTVEIIERIKEGLRRLALPVARVQSELFTPLITRCVLLLIRNGRIPYPPPELQGQNFGIEYIGELALALRNQQAKAFQQWAAFIVEMSEAFPDVRDNIDSDAAFRRMGRAFGVNEEDIATEEEVATKRQARAEQMAMMQAAQAAQVASESYGKTTKKPEEGSPAEKVMAGMGV